MRDLYVNTEKKCQWCKQPLVQILDGEPSAGKKIEEMVIAIVCPHCDGSVNYGANK